MEKNSLTAYLEREKKLKAKAKKIAVPLDEELQAIMICAVRYSLGRKSYMPGLVTGWIMNNCAGKQYRPQKWRWMRIYTRGDGH